MRISWQWEKVWRRDWQIRPVVCFSPHQKCPWDAQICPRNRPKKSSHQLFQFWRLKPQNPDKKLPNSCFQQIFEKKLKGSALWRTVFRKIRPQKFPIFFHSNSEQERNPKKGQLAGELQYLSERFWGGCSGVVGKCGRLEGDCGWNSFSARWVWNFSVSLEERKLHYIQKNVNKGKENTRLEWSTKTN